MFTLPLNNINNNIIHYTLYIALLGGDMSFFRHVTAEPVK